jgi:predicted permease
MDLLQEAGGMEGVGGFRAFSGTLIEPGKAGSRLSGASLTEEVLPLLGVRPALGRVPEPGEGSRTILLGHRIWVSDFGGDPGVLGRVVLLDGTPRTVVGVMPEGFAFPFNQMAWTILDSSISQRDGLELVGKLAPGTSASTVESHLSGLWSRLEDHRALERTGGRVQVDGFTSGRGEGGEALAFLGLVMVALALLFIACTNVANLLLVRATERVGRLAVQAALGAGRAQIALQISLESFFLALLGGLGGTALAWVVVEAIQKALAAEHFGYFWMRMAIDPRVLVFVSILVVGTAVFSGLLPVVRLLRTDLHGVLKRSSPGTELGGEGRWSQRFVTVQMALSCSALVAAGLAVVSMVETGRYGEDLDGESVLLASLSQPADRRVSWRVVEESMLGLPGASGVTLGLGAPGFGEPSGTFEMADEESLRPQDRPRVIWNAVMPSYFSTFDLSIVEGRGFEVGDDSQAPRVAVVSREFVRRHLPEENVLGRRILLDGPESPSAYTVVGIVEDLALGGGPHVVVERVYVPLPQAGVSGATALIRGAGVSPELVEDLRRRIAGVDAGIPVWSVQTLEASYRYLTRVYRAMGALAVGGGGAGLLVAGVGLYGLLAYWVRQRRRELGVRMAVGAAGRTLAMRVVSLAMRRVVPAAAVGLLLAWLAAPVLAVAFAGGDPRSPVVYGGVALAFMMVGLVAALFPALRVWRLEPAQILRGE